MKISFSVGRESGSLIVQREEGDRPAKASGFTRGCHGWGAEIHLLGMIAKRLNALGFNLIRRRMAEDGHMYGDDHMNYLVPPKSALRKRGMEFPCVYIYDGNYMIRSSAEDYNKGEEVYFLIAGNCYGETDDEGKTGPYNQPNWWEIVRDICEKHGIKCKIDEWLTPAKYEAADVLCNHHDEAELWTVEAYGRTPVDSPDDPEKIGDTTDFADEREGEGVAINDAETTAWHLVYTRQAETAVVLVNGNERCTFYHEYVCGREQVFKSVPGKPQPVEIIGGAK